MTKKADIYTIDGLLQILGDNINSINQDPSNENIRKSNAILQNVIAIKGIYSLAYDKRRLDNISHIQDDFSPYLEPKILGGSVFGDDGERLAQEHERDQKHKQKIYESVIERLKKEVTDNKHQPDVDQDHYLYQEFDESEYEIFNEVLNNADENIQLETEYKKDLYLLKHLTPADFGVEAGENA